LEWIKPETNGIAPCARYNHTMNYYEEGNYIIVHGGRNDYSNDLFSLNDTFIFELHRFEWIRVEIIFDSPKIEMYRRCGHGAIIYSKLKSMIF
jgi:hypothetical protein